MRISMFYHSALSDWNHGNAHFLRGVASELGRRGHEVRIFEPEDSWSRQNLLVSEGEKPIAGFRRVYPELDVCVYDAARLDLERALGESDLVLVHEWNSHELVRRIGEHRAGQGRYVLLFHDTHHRAVTDFAAMAAYDLSHYDGVLAFGDALRQVYLRARLARHVWTWHEAADVRVFRPLRTQQAEYDLCWVGNWGDDERTRELEEFLFAPVEELGLSAVAYGVRYGPAGLARLSKAGFDYGGFLPNYAVPEAFARARVTLHVPRRPYVKQLPGIPTIRVFEALACGVPLVCSPWEDREHLFTPGRDYLVAKDGREVKRHLVELASHPDAAQGLAAHGLNTILARHTCAHRVTELLSIYAQLRRERP